MKMIKKREGNACCCAVELYIQTWWANIGFTAFSANEQTNLFQPLKVLPEEGHGPVRPGGAQLDNAVLEQLLDVVFLHVLLALPQAPLLLAARTSRCHDDSSDPFAATFSFWSGGSGGSGQWRGGKIWAHWQIIPVTHLFADQHESRAYVSRDDMQGDGKCEKSRASMRTRRLQSIASASCNLCIASWEWKLVRWCEHTCDCRQTKTLSVWDLFTQSNLEKSNTHTRTHTRQWIKPTVQQRKP